MDGEFGPRALNWALNGSVDIKFKSIDMKSSLYFQDGALQKLLSKIEQLVKHWLENQEENMSLRIHQILDCFERNSQMKMNYP